MATINDQRHRLIRRTFLQGPEAVPELTLRLWERLACELISIIGEGGFQSLYSRSIHRNAAVFPWLGLRSQQNHSPQPHDSRFADLAISLEGRNSAEANEASIALLITFTDILAALIGERLTTRILHSAWGDNPIESAEKEHDNE
jgi:hypothetical protein